MVSRFQHDRGWRRPEWTGIARRDFLAGELHRLLAFERDGGGIGDLDRILAGLAGSLATEDRGGLSLMKKADC